MKNKKPKQDRLDIRLVELGLASNRTRAQAMIIAGNVLVDEVPSTKPGTIIKEDALIRLKEPEIKYVSRGALKLKKAIEEFKIEVKNKIALDVGSSTGGFTEILLENGIEKVFAIDVGTNQLAWKIRSDPRVISKENYNARYLKFEDFDTLFDLVVMDVSFISIKMIIPSLMVVSKKGTEFITLFKPQFEVGKEHVESGGIVKDQEIALKTLNELTDTLCKTCELSVKSMIPSPITGTDGNKEYLIYWIKN